MLGRIMTISLSILLAAALVFALYVLVYEIAALNRPDWRDIRPVGPVTRPARMMNAAAFGAPCERDGVLITSMDRLRAAVMMTSRTIATGHSLDGRKVSMLEVREDADRFAQLQVAPDVTLEQLARCDESLLRRYPHGYWLISSALVRESAKRRGITSAHYVERAQ